jgi:hypothetical protein
LIKPLGSFDRVSVGFPGVVRAGHVMTAPNLGNESWRDYPLAPVLTDRLGKPVRMLNDATVHGLGVIKGSGLECVITTGHRVRVRAVRQWPSRRRIWNWRIIRFTTTRTTTSISATRR